MMYSIEVFGDYYFLKDPVRIGVLEYERIKGYGSYRFSYDDEYLKRFSGIAMSADLGNFSGWQSARKTIFSCFGDALPDRWGRALIDKRERMQAENNGRIPRKFDDFGYLVRIDDITRMGALRFKYKGEFIPVPDREQTVPPLTSLESFIREAHEIELADKSGQGLVREDWLDNVWRQGSSLGGARPKANVKDGAELWIAKIPSVNDEYDIALWEHFAISLAGKCGIRIPETRLIRVGPTPFHTLLSKRFDRMGDKRIHFASSLTLTGFRDGDNAETGKGYIDIAETIIGNVGAAHPVDDLHELFRRIAFNICIGNQDDHFRNHGFLLTEEGWVLSPAYDINPSNALNQSLMITPYSNRSSLKSLLDTSDNYLIERDIARDIIREVVTAFGEWKTMAGMIGIPKAEQARFEKRFEYSISEGRSL